MQEKPFNIGIYIADSLVETNPEDGSGGDYNLAELYISVSGPDESATCIMWNDLFESYGKTIDPNDDLIVEPVLIEVLPGDDGQLGTNDDVYVYAYSMEYDEAVSKLGDVPGWTGNVVCLVDTAGDYKFTLTTAGGISLGEFTITVK